MGNCVSCINRWWWGEEIDPESSLEFSHLKNSQGGQIEFGALSPSAENFASSINWNGREICENRLPQDPRFWHIFTTTVVLALTLTTIFCVAKSYSWEPSVYGIAWAGATICAIPSYAMAACCYNKNNEAN